MEKNNYGKIHGFRFVVSLSNRQRYTKWLIPYTPKQLRLRREKKNSRPLVGLSFTRVHTVYIFCSTSTKVVTFQFSQGGLSRLIFFIDGLFETTYTIQVKIMSECDENSKPFICHQPSQREREREKEREREREKCEKSFQDILSLSQPNNAINVNGFSEKGKKCNFIRGAWIILQFDNLFDANRKLQFGFWW